jgi:hypothetical protein
MKVFLYGLLAILSAVNIVSAHAEEPLRFAAEVSDEALAEDAILLVHCLATRTSRGWELGGEAKGPYFLRVTEKDAKLTAVYRGGAEERSFTFAAGASDSACDKLEPTAGLLAASNPLAAEVSPLAALAPPSPLAAVPRGELLSAADDEPPAWNKTYLWVGAGIAAVVGGFLVLHAHSHRADFNSVQMN